MRSFGGRRGFTLVEMLVVILIVLVLAGLLMAAVMKAITKSDEMTTKKRFGDIERAYEIYVQVMKPATFPSSAATLRSALRDAQANKGYPDGFLPESRVADQFDNGTTLWDAWGKDIQCPFADEKGVRLWSLGADGTQNTRDDIKNF